MSSKIGLFTGSFDPITNGHLDLIERASKLFDHLYIGIFFNKDKTGLLPIDKRQATIEQALSHLDNVTVLTSHSRLTVDVAKELGVTALVRGLRNAQDLTYEASMDFFNHELAPELETVYLLSKPALSQVSSSRIRELIHFGADISPYVPASVLREMEVQSQHESK